VFLDIKMPGMDGEEVARARMDRDPLVKTGVVTGIGMDDERVQTLRSLGA
jgi:CheY-like chemotaxis protein